MLSLASGWSIIEFPTRQHAEDWYNDPEYQQLVSDANAFIERIAVIIDGCTG